MSHPLIHRLQSGNRLFLLATTALLCTISVVPAVCTAENIAKEVIKYILIVNRQTPVDNISTDELKGLLTGSKRYFGHSDRAIRIILPASEVRRSKVSLLDGILGISALDFATTWRRIGFSSNPIQPPVSFARNAETAAAVYRVPNTLGILAVSGNTSLPAKLAKVVRVLSVNGKTPDNPDYSLIYIPVEPNI